MRKKIRTMFFIPFYKYFAFISIGVDVEFNVYEIKFKEERAKQYEIKERCE
jgi:hypothetical protein